jgi:hypothetical protein
MKQITFILPLIAATLFLSCNRQITDNGLSINPLLGDISFVDKFGHQPTATTDEDLRIKTHLEYVEILLRQKEVSNLTPEEQEKRKNILDLLHVYWTTGIFPRNYDHIDKRVPYFIDKDGKICAVGYLVEQTADRQSAEKINDIHKYDKLLAMNDHTLESWIRTSGLTKEECAMIQPTYGPPPTYNYNYFSPQYGIASSVLGGVNLSLNTINAIQISKGTHNKTIPVISLLTGTGSIIYGAYNFPKEDWSGMYAKTNESQKTLSMVNIGLGTTTMILSVWNLSANRQKKDRSVAWNFYSFPTTERQMGLGFYLTKKL